jgi:hypothetical protein
MHAGNHIDVCVQLVHERVGTIKNLCMYTCGRGRASVYMHTGASMIALKCTHIDLGG